jgi:hypothetical protein
MRELLLAAVIAGTFSGAPSTVHALVTGWNPLDAIRAAATLVPGSHSRSTTRQLATGLAVHGMLTLGWTAVLTGVLPRRDAVAWGAAAGLGIAALDLGIVGPRYPAIAALPVGGQIADHVAFGAIVGLVLSRAADRGPQVSPSRDR